MKLAAPFVITPADDILAKHPQLKSLLAQVASAHNQHQLVSAQALQKIGELLWQALDVESEFTQNLKAARTNILPIVIATNNPAIAKLPWESLYHPKHKHLGTAKRFTLSRKILDEPLTSETQASETQTSEPQITLEKGPLRVLLFTSLPDYPEHEFSTANRLNMEEEQAQVLEALLPLMREGKVSLEMPDDGRFETLRDTITETSPHVVFLSGHGSYIKPPLSDETAQAVFEFEDIDGAPKPMDAADMFDAFVGSNVQCLVLSACESAKLAGTDNDSLTQQMAELGINNVVGMSESVADYVGHYFAQYFCKAIGKGHLATTAVQQARQSIAEMKQVPEHIAAKQAAIERFNAQWHFPVLYSNQCNQQLIDWDFTPEPVVYEQLNIQLHQVSQPKRFIGRRMELRKVQSQIKAGQHQWLFTGPGGQGKTALAGKIAHKLDQQGHQVFAWSAKQYQSMDSFISKLQYELNGDFAKAYDDKVLSFTSEYDKALHLLQQLCRQQQAQKPNAKVVLFLDNLESLQCEQNYELTSKQVSAWIQAATALGNDGLVLILTSRWKMPHWPEENCIQLSKLRYHDFIMLAQTLNCPLKLLEQKDRLRRLHKNLHGNGRGLEFFLAAINSLNEDERKAQKIAEFEQQLANSKEELQTDMALNVIARHLDDNDKIILQRITAYQSPVPVAGILKLVDALTGVTMEKQTALTSLQRLVNCSLVEQHKQLNKAVAYFCSPVVSDWLYSDNNNYVDNPPLPEPVLVAAADYQLELFKTTKQTSEQAFEQSLEQSLVVYNAYLATEQKDTAYQFAIDYIIGRLELAGLSQTLLDKWMPQLQQAQGRKLQGEVIGRKGKLYLNLGDYNAALDYFKQSLVIVQKIGDKQGEGISLNNMAQIYQARGDYDTALDYLKQSLAIMQEIGDKQGEGTSLNNICTIYHAKGDYDTALDYLKQSSAIKQEMGDKQGEGTSLNNISQIYDIKGDYDTALDYLEQSLVIAQEIGDKQGEGTTLNNISRIYKSRGDYDTALGYLKQSLAIVQEIGDKQGEGTTLNNISQIYKPRGDYDTALGYLKQSLVIVQEIGDKQGEGTTLNNISQIYDIKGDYDTALDYLKQSLVIAEEIGDKKGKSTTLNNISQIYKARGDYDTALNYLKQSLAIVQEIGDKQGEGTSLNNISQIYKARGDYDTALDYLKQSLVIMQEIGDTEGLCATLFNIGHIHAQNNEQQEAMQTWLTVYNIANTTGFAQALQALEKLAEQIGLPNGLAGWEALYQQALSNEQIGE